MEQPSIKLNKSITKVKSRTILIGSIVAILIAITPYLFYTYEYFPDTPTFEIAWFTYESKFNLSIYVTMWLLMGKLVPLLLLILWFFTCKHWWYHILLIPIAMFSFQIFSAIAQDTNTMDEAEIYWLIPIMLIVTPFVYFIRVKLFDKHVLGIDLEAMDAELKVLRQKEVLGKEKMEVTEENIDTVESIEDDLSANTSNKALDQMVKQFRHAMRSLLNL